MWREITYEFDVTFENGRGGQILYNFDQFVSHASQGPLTKRNLVSVTGHLAA